MISRVYSFLFLILLASTNVKGQEVWDLRKCVEYALEHNITVRQADLQIRFAELDLQQSKLSQYPGANFSTSAGYSSGRNQDPTTFGLITTGYTFNNTTLQASVDLFNWFSKKNTVASRELDLKATQEGVEKAKNDVALNVAVAYLQVLLGREQVVLARAQVAQTLSQLESTRKQVDAGKLPELNAANLESVLASDSSALISAEISANKLLLQMKVLLNLDPALPFEIATPPVDMIPVESLGDLQPEAVYNLATVNMPQQKVDNLNIQSALKAVKAARGSMYPTISLFGSLGTSFNNRAQEIKSTSQINAPIGTVNVSGVDYQVFPNTPFTSYNYGKINYFDQVNQNFRQSIGINISVPILNGGSLRTAWQRSKLNVKSRELQKEQNQFILKQDIYNAYNDAVAALQKFNADTKTVETSQIAYDYAAKRYELGLLSTYDLVTTQTNLARAKSQRLYSQYDYVFKMKLLEFYKGQGLKL
ncbi:MAG TPA: TolC family protein [Chitinophagaceae bacterium]|nr:TolC family protein [Chitinophagaceae bacterium]